MRRVPVLVVVLAAIGFAFVALPLVGLLVEAPWSALGDQLGSEEVRQALGLTLVTSAVTTAVAVVVGVPLGVVLARGQGRLLGLVRAAVTVPLALPPVVGGVALLLTFGRRGFIGGTLDDVADVRIAFTPIAVVLAQLFVSLPFLVAAVESGVRALDRDHEEVAATLGAGPGRVLWRVTLPMAGSAVGAGAVLCWARAVGELGATITFAGNLPGRTQTVSLATFLALERDPEAAVALSVVLLATSLAVLVALRGRWIPAFGRLRSPAASP